MENPNQQAITPSARKVRQKRTVNSLWILVILAVAVTLYHHSGWLMRWMDPQAQDLGIEILQPMVVALIYQCWFTVASTLMAAFMENQLREGAFGGYSRFGVCFVLSYLGACIIAAAIL
jgi:hypothetical protein